MKYVEINCEKINLTEEECLERFKKGDHIGLYHIYDNSKQFFKIQNLVLSGKYAENTYTLSLPTGTWKATVTDCSPELTIKHFFQEE